jgi:ankyrin repeat protein
VRAFAFLLLLAFFQSPTFAPIQQEARKKLSEAHVPYTPDAFIQGVIAGDKEKVEWFLKAGMSSDVAYNGEKNFKVNDRVISNGDSALIIAMILGYEEIRSLLLSYGADVNKPSSFPASPLLIAKGDFVKTLLDRGADINWRGYAGRTVLMSAAAEGDLNKVTVLLESGADINSKNDDGETAIHCAAVAGQREVFAFLRARGADISTFSERSLKMFLNDPDPNDEIMSLIQRLRRVTH